MRSSFSSAWIAPRGWSATAGGSPDGHAGASLGRRPENPPVPNLQDSPANHNGHCRTAAHRAGQGDRGEPPRRGRCVMKVLHVATDEGIPTATNPKRLTATANRPILAPKSDLCKLIWCTLIGLFRSRAALEAGALSLRNRRRHRGARLRPPAAAPSDAAGIAACGGRAARALT